MIKPKHPKRADISQLARSMVEHATGVPVTPRRKIKANKHRKEKTLTKP